jgi:hypothetical protein
MRKGHQNMLLPVSAGILHVRRQYGRYNLWVRAVYRPISLTREKAAVIVVLRYIHFP